MKHAHTVLTVASAAFVMAMAIPAWAQADMDHSKMDHSKMGMAPAPGMTEGEVRKVDKESGKITLKHAAIKHLDMSPMTMVFTVKDKALLDKVQVGQKVTFAVVNENSKMVVTDIQPTQ